MEIRFHPEALVEYTAAADHYAAIDSTLALRFADAVEHAVARISDAPAAWPTIDQDVRRCLTRVFPFALLFTVEPTYVLIVSVMHCSREPGYWTIRRDR